MELDSAHIILKTILKSEQDCMVEVIYDLNNHTEEEDLIKIVKDWIDRLQDVSDDAERLEVMESAIYCAQSSMEDIQTNLDDLGGHLNV